MEFIYASEHILATTYTRTPHFKGDGTPVGAPVSISRGKLSWRRAMYYYGLLTRERTRLSIDIDNYGFGTVQR